MGGIWIGGRGIRRGHSFWEPKEGSRVAWLGVLGMNGRWGGGFLESPTGEFE